MDVLDVYKCVDPGYTKWRGRMLAEENKTKIYLAGKTIYFFFRGNIFILDIYLWHQIIQYKKQAGIRESKLHNSNLRVYILIWQIKQAQSTWKLEMNKSNVTKLNRLIWKFISFLEKVIDSHNCSVGKMGQASLNFYLKNAFFTLSLQQWMFCITRDFLKTKWKSSSTF